MSTLKKEALQWGVMFSIVGILYVTGWHTTVMGTLQGLIVKTGLLSTDALADDEKVAADYNFLLRDAQGNVVDFSTFKGKTVFLNFWATWCPPCIAEMPDIQDLYEQKTSEDLAFVMISVDEQPQKAIDYMKRKAFGFPVYFLASKRPGVFKRNSIPTTFVLSPEGQIVLTREGMASYNTSKFRDFLNEVNGEIVVGE